MWNCSSKSKRERKFYLFLFILLSGECHKTPLISQHWLRQWLDAVRQHAITWASVHQNICRYTVSLDHNELINGKARIQPGDDDILDHFA